MQCVLKLNFTCNTQFNWFILLCQCSFMNRLLLSHTLCPKLKVGVFLYFYSTHVLWYIFTFLDIDECASQPCLNNGTCTDYVDLFTCTCLPGFTDVNCGTGIMIVLNVTYLPSMSFIWRTALYQCFALWTCRYKRMCKFSLSSRRLLSRFSQCLPLFMRCWFRWI